MGLVGSTSTETMVIKIDCRAHIPALIVSFLFISIQAALASNTILELDLPEYDSYETLRQQVYTAMTAGSEYFGFA